LKRALALAALLAAAPACHHDQNAVLLIVVTASGTPPVVASLDVTLTTGRTAPSTNSYAHGTDPILFPTTLSAELPGYATGDVSIEVRADDAAGATVASGRVGPIPIHPGERQTVYVRLDCGGDACIVDGGTGNDDGGMPSSSPRCGNGRIDLGETCDTAIPPGDPGGCPLSCDDHIGCTRDTRAGSDCTVSCSHERIDDPAPGDGCCPPGYTYDGVFRDSDCSPQRRRRQGRDVRHGDPAGPAGGLPDDRRLQTHHLRHGRCDLARHLFGCLHLAADDRAVGQGARQLLPARRHQRQRQRLPDRVWQRRVGGHRRGALRPRDSSRHGRRLPDHLRRR
jgi:hypothetical protein